VFDAFINRPGSASELAVTFYHAARCINSAESSLPERDGWYAALDTQFYIDRRHTWCIKYSDTSSVKQKQIVCLFIRVGQYRSRQQSSAAEKKIIFCSELGAAFDHTERTVQEGMPPSSTASFALWILLCACDWTAEGNGMTVVVAARALSFATESVIKRNNIQLYTPKSF
jgi:hypothetical protein